MNAATTRPETRVKDRDANKSLLMTGVWHRVLGAMALAMLLWAAVGWALR